MYYTTRFNYVYTEVGENAKSPDWKQRFFDLG